MAVKHILVIVYSQRDVRNGNTKYVFYVHNVHLTSLFLADAKEQNIISLASLASIALIFCFSCPNLELQKYTTYLIAVP
jgi:hypothetical protein